MITATDVIDMIYELFYLDDEIVLTEESLFEEVSDDNMDLAYTIDGFEQKLNVAITSDDFRLDDNMSDIAEKINNNL